MDGHCVCQEDGETFGNASRVRFDRDRQVGGVVLANYQDAKAVAEVGDLVCQYLLRNQRLWNN